MQHRVMSAAAEEDVQEPNAGQIRCLWVDYFRKNFQLADAVTARTLTYC